jgi:hypothetical protein
MRSCMWWDRWRDSVRRGRNKPTRAIEIIDSASEELGVIIMRINEGVVA